MEIKVEKISGVYKINNTSSGDFYIGSSKDIKRRWHQHKCLSVWTKQPNSRMYKDMAQYGLNNFTFEIIEETDNLKEREQYWIEQLSPTYNTNRASGWDIDKRKESQERYRHTDKWKEYKKDYDKAYQKEYQQTEKGKDAHRRAIAKYRSQLCLYEGETLTLGALSTRFYKQGIAHPVLEAKKYIIAN